ncbi:NAD(P)H-dependent oxidoreductase [Campylobacter sp. MIT 21-1685]|uniref:NAD(P)H-dependent oxidoreductase n=1 Tax=unclassified Campylobacter TaxID=2593542 RepID=UPI00224B82B2|nr:MULTISPECIES: NAD(P)H-dependent oxidoreductase [unclassified Campylobacter]MCX2683403.1 NAD(P)H-dependent oxidoreductase [Campylobacter sp. MIT 21-1684]MCX2751670.1 NAD(P)H-dependent oxidoreductase [Campylobacter sp. MIT 21-1682]MCX2807871.1 NAD(P)H-dependent oxidoreductase [Campylobacter sp. MIT 21-1685]
MAKILLLNGGKVFGNSGGRLSQTLHDVAKQTLQGLGYETLQTHIDKGYEPQTEVQKWLESQAIIYQMPGWWMGEPWIVKKYIDEVGIAAAGKFFTSDGRHSDNPTKGYGTGGLLKDKKYMFSLTWNAPLEGFNEPNDFFNGVGVESVYLHKAHEFMGMQGLPSFICNDVVKNLQVEQYIKDYEAHLKRVFSK